MPTYLKDGMYGVTLSCFDKNGRLDEALLHIEMQHCARTRTDGLVLGGSTGEFLYLSPQEHHRSLALAMEVAGSEKTLIAGACGPTERDVLHLMEDAAALGYQYALVCPPYYYPQGQTQVLEFYQHICKHAPSGMGILLYNIPFCTASISLSILPALMQQANLIGMKDSSGDMLYFVKARAIMQKEKPEASLFTGQDAMLLPSLAVGGNGCMSSGAWLLDGIERSIFTAQENGKLHEARAYQDKLVCILMWLDGIPFPENYRALAQACGIDCGKPQRPFSCLEGETFSLWRQNLLNLMA